MLNEILFDFSLPSEGAIFSFYYDYPLKIAEYLLKGI